MSLQQMDRVLFGLSLCLVVFPLLGVLVMVR